MSFKKWGTLCCTLLFLCTFLAACGKKEADQPEKVVADPPLQAENQFTDRDRDDSIPDDAVLIKLAEDSSNCSSSLVRIQDRVVTITGAGVYRLSGTLTGGRIVVDAGKQDKLRLILDGVTVECGSSAALYIKQADKVFVTLAADSVNSLSTQQEFIAVDDNSVDGAVFSKEDLTFNGTGTLKVNCSQGHGVVCKDSLVFMDGSYTIAASGHSVQGKDDVRIAGGSYALTAGKDGIHVEQTEDSSLGYLYIADGSFSVTAQGDGFSASGSLQVDGGTGTITSGGGAAAANSSDSRDWFWQREPSSAAAGSTTSAKGVKATGALWMQGGAWTLDTADDALHSNGDLTVTDGSLVIATGDDGLHADGALRISGGQINISRSYEGLEGQTVDIAGGTISVVASDDGVNAAGGADESGFGGRMPSPDGFRGGRGGENNRSDNESSTYIRISGGKITVNAAGDGLDSNGNLFVTGGETYVSGPEDSGNGALDYDGTAQISGGILVAAGAQGMAQNFTSAVDQGAMLVSVGGSGIGAVTLKNSAGELLLDWTPEKTYSCVVVSCPEIQKGESYVLSLAGQTVNVTMEDWLYTTGGQGGGMGKPSGMGKI